MTLNKVMLIGNVGADPEMRYTPNGNPVTEFRMAVNRRYTTSDGEQREETEWFRISAWTRLAETVNQYVVKGMKVYVEGRLSSRAYMDREGQPRTSLEVSASTVLFLDRAGSAPYDETGEGRAVGEPVPAAGPAAGTDAGAAPAEDVEELPW